jgi:ATP-binding cassette subfamily B protein
MSDSSFSLAAKLKLLLAQIPYLPRAFKLVWAAARVWMIAWAALLCAQGLLPAATVLLMRSLVNSLVLLLNSHGDGNVFGHTIFLAALMAAIMLLSEILSSVASWVRTSQAELVQDHLLNLIHEQALRLDLSYYETPDYYDQLHRARVDAVSRPLALLENGGHLIQSTITLAALAVVLITYAWWLPLVLFFGTLPAFLVAGRNTWRFHQWRLRNTHNERRTRYYDMMLTWRQAAAELRLFNLGRRFRAAYQELRGKLRRERLGLIREKMVADLFAGLIGLVVMGMTMAWLLWRSVRGLANLGDMALFYQVFIQSQRLMRALLGSVAEGYRNLLFLENLFEFMELKPVVVDPEKPVALPSASSHEIRLESVSFRYPGSQRTALHDFNLIIPAGKITAVVGENGAGKSTLIKLLCRFYDPEEGIVTLGGVNLRSLSQADLFRQITVLFQEPVHYHDTAADNIAFGEPTAEPGREQIQAAAIAAGAHEPISRLPEGYNTVLGKWFGGAELSVGEWQRVALARAFIRQASLVILDEPTSAMDSWAEADWMARFRDLVAGRTALIITHRFTTALKADIIHVMEQGRIIESGSHSQLLQLDGRYAWSWKHQTRESCLEEPDDIQGGPVVKKP